MMTTSETHKLKNIMKHCVLAFMLMAFVTGIAWAEPVTFELVGVNDQSLMASVTFGYNPTIGTISIAIENLSLIPPNTDPRITSFAFNTPVEVSGVLEASSQLPDGWTISYSPDDINTPGNYGRFDLAGITGPDFQGGSPNSGIPAGSEFHFEIVLSGTNLGTLTEERFLELISADEPGNTSSQYFIARFQRTGIDGEGSDVGTPSGPPTPAPVPEPATLLLLGVRLVGLAGLRRKKQI